MSYIKYINEFRVTCLNLKKRKSGMLMYKTNGQRIPIIYPLSQHIFQDVKSWGENVYISGFFFYNEDNQVMDEKLEKFICRGSKPIVISLSSTRLKNPERFQQNLIYSLKKTNNRAVILTGISGMNIKNEENIYVTEKSPHRLLFKRAKAIIHHGGAGTVSEALISGVPQIIIPFSADQPFWAYRLCKNNYAINLKNEKKATKDALIQALNDIEKEVYLENAEKIKDIVKLEKGIANAVKYIERTV